MDENKRAIFANILAYVSLMIVSAFIGAAGVQFGNEGASLLGFLFSATSFLCVVQIMLRTTFDRMLENWYRKKCND